MKYGGKLLACVAGGLALGSTANAITSDTAGNPYQSIVDRNVFSLKPPPPPPDPAEANKPQALKITLTGITTILGNKRVLMKTAPPPGKPGEAPKTEQSYILTEGQREGEIEVISIDEKAGSVKVSNAGSIQTLTFEKDGAKLPSTPAPVGVPGGPVPIPGLPVLRPTPQPPVNSATPSFQLPTRIPRLPTPGAQTSVAAPGGFGGNLAVGEPAAAVPSYLPGNVTSPVAQNSGAQNLSQPAQPSQTMSLEEQAIMIEANRMRGGPGAALLPPTILTPKMNEGANPVQTPVQQNTLVLPTPGRPLPPGQY